MNITERYHNPKEPEAFNAVVTIEGTLNVFGLLSLSTPDFKTDDSALEWRVKADDVEVMSIRMMSRAEIMCQTWRVVRIFVYFSRFNLLERRRSARSTQREAINN